MHYVLALVLAEQPDTAHDVWHSCPVHSLLSTAGLLATVRRIDFESACVSKAIVYSWFFARTRPAHCTCGCLIVEAIRTFHVCVR